MLVIERYFKDETRLMEVIRKFRLMETNLLRYSNIEQYDFILEEYMNELAMAAKQYESNRMILP